MKQWLSHLSAGLVGGFLVWIAGTSGVSLAPSNSTPPQPEQPRGISQAQMPQFSLRPVQLQTRTKQQQQGEPAKKKKIKPPQLQPHERLGVEVYEKVNRSVVNITTQAARVDPLFLFQVPSEGAGSGSVLDKSGHILTNFHVVESARRIEVTLFNGKSYDAEFIGADPINDIAVLKIDAPKETLFPVSLGESSNLLVGMQVYAIGNPFGLERTLTTGVVSSLNRSLKIRNDRTVKSIIQIDAAINPGNSGGPLLDSRGNLIGMNTAIASRTGQNSGVGFAIPVDLVKRVVPQLIMHGRVIRADIGIARVYETDQGLLIAALVPDGPAEKAGLRGPKVVRRRRGPFIYETIDRDAADLIITIDGQPISSGDEFLEIVESKKPGDKVLVGIIREEKELVIPVTLGLAE